MKTDKTAKKTGPIIGRTFCFTWNNYPENYKEIISQYDNIKYLITGEELSKTGTPHLQGFIKTKDVTTLKKISKTFGNCHVELTKGSDTDNDNYCRGIGETAKNHGKNPTEPEKLFIIGKLENKQGQRNDLKKIKDAVQNGDKITDIINNLTENYNDLKYAESLMKYNEKPRIYADTFNFIWVYGPTETGKTRYVLSERFKTEYETGKIYMAMNSSKWWDGYDGQEILFIDDFRDSFCTFSNLLQICQPIEYRVEVKGGTRQLKAMTVIITSCFSPAEVYTNVQEKHNQLLRRITELIHFYKLGEYKDETSELKEVVEMLKDKDNKNEISFKSLAKELYT